jgi:hypothetical protein
VSAPKPCEAADCNEPVTRPGARFHTVRCARRSRPVAPRPTKQCKCGATFERPGGSTHAAWEKQESCSISCSNRYGPLRGRAKGTGGAKGGASAPSRVVDHSVRRTSPNPRPQPERPVWRPAGFTPTPNTRRAS